MSFHFRCPNCNAKLEAEDEWEGQETTCPQCNTEITVTRGAPEIRPDTEQSSPKNFTDRSIRELTSISVTTTVKQGRKLAQLGRKNRNKIIVIMELLLLVCSFELIISPFLKDEVQPFNTDGYSSGSTGASRYSSSVTVGNSSYATAQNTSKLLSNTSDIIHHIQNTREFINYQNYLLKNYLTAIVLILIVIWLEILRSNQHLKEK